MIKKSSFLFWDFVFKLISQLVFKTQKKQNLDSWTSYLTLFLAGGWNLTDWNNLFLPIDLKERESHKMINLIFYSRISSQGKSFSKKKMTDCICSVLLLRLYTVSLKLGLWTQQLTLFSENGSWTYSKSRLTVVE